VIVITIMILAAAWILISAVAGGTLKIIDYARKAGFAGDDLTIAVAIALAESSGKVDAVGDKNLAPEYGPSLGLWQINMGTRAHASEFADLNLFDPQVNANAAFKLYSRAGNSFRDWSTFTQNNPKTGQPYYISHLDDVTTSEVTNA